MKIFFSILISENLKIHSLLCFGDSLIFSNPIYDREIVRSELKFGVNSRDDLAKYEDFSFQPIGALELRSMTSELRIMFRE